MRTEIKILPVIFSNGDLLPQVFTNPVEYAVNIIPQDGEVLVLGRIEYGNVLILVKDSRPRVALEGMGATSSNLPGGQITARRRATRGRTGVDDHPLDCAAPSRKFFACSKREDSPEQRARGS